MKRTLAAFLLTVAASFGGVITSPTAIVAHTGGEASPGDIQTIIDRSGLTPTFVSGVTDFDTYLAGNPVHTSTYFGFEWFGSNGVSEATITLDMGAILNLTRLAFWNDEFSGTSRLSVLSCSDASCTTTTSLGSFSPVNNAAGVPSYSAEVFDIADAMTRYVRLDVVGPQADYQGWASPSIGEVAFDAGSAVPEPSSLLLILAAVPVAMVARRKRDR